jgi:ankyrin repeat protein
VLNDLPKTLDETYGRALLGIDEEKREHAQQLFRCLTMCIRPLRVEELAEVFAIRFNKTGLPTFNAAWRPDNVEEAVISACSSLIAIVDMDGSRVVQFSHFTIKEFLTSERLAMAEERLSYYHILPEPAHTLLAHVCLSVLVQLDDKIDRDAITHFPLALYAARHWVDHAQFGNVSSHIQEIMEHLFDAAKPHFAAWVWLYDIDRHWIGPMSEIHPTQPQGGPLYYAALCGFRGIMEHLLAANSLDIKRRGGIHTTPLHAASVKGRLDVVSLLLENGAYPDDRDDRGRSPLHKVLQGGQLVMGRSSLDVTQPPLNFGADVNAADDEGWTPLHAAARSGYRDAVEMLLSSGATLDVRNKKQRTPLHLSCGYGKLEVSRYLIYRGSDENSWDEHGFIPLHMASRYGHIDVARLLLDRGADANIQRDDHWSPLHLASANGHLEIVKLLVERGASVGVKSVGFVGTL